MADSSSVAALREGAAYRLRPEQRTLRLSGPDRVRFLNGMVTNDVSALAVGAGQLAFKTNNKGKSEGLLRIRATEDAFLLEVHEFSAERVRSVLDMYIIMDDCTVEDVSATRSVLSVVGPKAAALLSSAGVVVPELAPHHFAPVSDVTVVADRSFGVPGFEVMGSPDAVEAVRGALASTAAIEAELAAFDVVRVESGCIVDGRDLDDDTIPLETRLDEAISHVKGCYVGQEVIARATNLGQVNYQLVGLAFEAGAAGAEGAKLTVDGKTVGEVCSTVETGAGWIALGYLHRKHLAVNTRLDAQADGQTFVAEVRALPFVAIP